MFDPSKKASLHSHLVAQIKVDDSYFELHKEETSSSKWYLFNDFHVLPIPVNEVLDFNFKNPCVLFYRNVALKSAPVVPPKLPITEEVFLADNPIKT